jgi:GlpG protein
MRLVGEFENKSEAGRFSDYLTHTGIENRVMEEEGVFEVWVHVEDEVENAEKLLKQFLEEGVPIDYQEVAKKARQMRKEAEKEAKDGPRYLDARTTIFYRGPAPNGALTLLLILASVAVAIFSELGKNPGALRGLFITDIQVNGRMARWIPGLQEIMRGEVWRLFTPMFIHFDILHLLFNMLWLKDLGSMIEDRKGSLFLAVFILVVSAASNLSQYLVSTPLFGGMSGVVYGLLGYIWMKGKYDPGSRLALHKSIVIMMITWYFLCFTGLMGPVANAAHTAGLVIGVAWGFLTSKKLSDLLKKK